MNARYKFVPQAEVKPGQELQTDYRKGKYAIIDKATGNIVAMGDLVLADDGDVEAKSADLEWLLKHGQELEKFPAADTKLPQLSKRMEELIEEIQKAETPEQPTQRSVCQQLEQFMNPKLGEPYSVKQDLSLKQEVVTQSTSAAVSRPEHYCIGFMFSDDRQSVLLIEKKRPDWQKGFYNGIGGARETFDTDMQHCMVREFAEETGIFTVPSAWTQTLLCKSKTKDWALHIFSAIGPIHQAKTITDERPVIVGLDSINVWPLVPSVAWMVPICLDDRLQIPLEIWFK